MRVRYLAFAAVIALSARGVAAQSADHVALGDQAHQEMKPADALAHYEAAIKADSSNYEALWKAARAAGDLADYEQDRTKQRQLFGDSEQFSRRALQLNPADAEGHFYLARSLGKVALSLGKRDRVKYAGEVRSHALAALKSNPDHPGALHVMGSWNAEVMRLDGFSRFMAKQFLGGKIFSSASWDDAKKYMERAVAVDPDRLVHHLDLAEIYLDTGDKAKAKQHLERVISGKATDYNDRFYKEQAATALKKV